MNQQLVLLELNEVNFDFIRKYCARGLLPHFQALLRDHAIVRTTSERTYETLEPWIQWVTAHTGLRYDEHGVFRLGDIVKKDLPQIWEVLEEQGLSVGALSPMNAKHRLKAPAFFVPDPWTSTTVSAPRILKRLYEAIAQAVNDNAQSRVTLSSALGLGVGLLRYARTENYKRYLGYVLSSRSRPWRKAMFLDQLLTDVFIGELKRARPDFSSLFLNAAAHIQHHYMFCSSSYEGKQRNPDWYIGPNEDPLYEIFESYDRAVGAVRTAFPEARLMIATGLHQVPHEELTYYWRLKDHRSFLEEIGIECARCEPRMSRDFLLTFSDSHIANAASDRLSRAVAADGAAMFEVDNRGTDLFVTLCYSRTIDAGFTFSIDGQPHHDLDQKVAFVALKNGEHDGVGYLIDTGMPRGEEPLEIPLTQVPARIADAFGLQFPNSTKLDGLEPQMAHVS